MVGLLGYALAGGLAGYGNSLVEEAKAKREAAMEELRNQRLMEREDRQYQRQNARDDKQWERQQQRDNTQYERGITTSGKPVMVNGAYRLLRQDGTLGDITDGGEPFTGEISTVRESDPNPSTAQQLTQIRASQSRLKDSFDYEDITDEASFLRETGVSPNRVDGFMRTELSRLARANGDNVNEILQKYGASASSKETEQPAPAAATTPTQRPAGSAAQGSSLGASAGATIGSAAQQQRLPAGYTPEQVVEEAKKAVAAGKDPTAVRSRLREMGIDPSQAGL